MILLGIDPGTNNAAYGVMEIRINPFRFRVLECGMFKHPVKEIVGEGILQRSKKFSAEVRKLKRVHRVTHVIAERFMTRGHGGTTIEAVGIQLGIIAMSGISNCMFISSATWKNRVNKRFVLDDFYATCKVLGIPAHVVDGVCIGLYGACHWSATPHFETVTTKQLLQQIRKTIQWLTLPTKETKKRLQRAR